jgi:hypothetical protein
MTHLAPRLRAMLAVEMKMICRVGKDFLPLMHFRANEVAHCDPRAASAVSPSGSPQMARIWFSNWLVSAPSIVQWPLLWTRGAISLNTGPVSHAKNSRVSTPT